MKIVEFLAENVKRLSVVEIKPNGNLVQITGANGSGKTSVLDSIAWALQGTSGVQKQPIRKGHKTARIRIDLGDVVVTRSFTEDGSKLVVESADGARFPSPQAVLDRLLGSIAFDPLAFARQKPKEQFDTLRGLVKVDVDFAEIDRHNQSDFTKRTELNRDAKALRARMAACPELPPNLPAAPIDTSALVDEIAKAGAHNAAIEKREEGREKTLRDAEQKEKSAEQNRLRASELRIQANALDRKAEAEDAEAADMRKKVAEAPPLPKAIDPAAVRAKLTEAERINAHLVKRAQFEELKRSAEKTEADAEKLTVSMAKREKQKQDAIAAAKMPIEGIGFGDGAVTLNGLPFEQASDAEQLRASCAIAMAMNPKLRVLRIRDGSLLDENGLALLAEMADTNDFQIWLEKVDTSGKVGVVLEDGHLKDAPVEAEKEVAHVG